MQVKIRYFANLREQMGCAEEVRRVDVGTTIAELYRILFGAEPSGIRFACNAVYVDSQTILEDGDEVAFLPPMGGG